MKLEKKIIACYGNLKVRSISRVLSIPVSTVNYFFRKNNLKAIIKNHHRSFKGYYTKIN